MDPGPAPRGGASRNDGVGGHAALRISRPALLGWIVLVHWITWSPALAARNHRLHRHAAITGRDRHGAPQCPRSFTHSGEAMAKFVITEQAAAIVAHTHQNRAATAA